jgi:hypothetical protein
MNGRTFLFPLELQGFGSADVESLSSYLWRHSEAHQVPIGIFLRLGFDWLSRRDGVPSKAPYFARNPGTLAHYVRPTENTRAVVNLLSAGTREDNLRCATFLALEQGLDRCMKTFHNSVRWCPACLAEQEAEGAIPYFKLAWSLASLTQCPTHGLPLLDRCPHCSAKQCGFGLRGSCTTCARCQKSLCDQHHGAPVPGTWRVESKDLWKLLGRIGSTPDVTFQSGGTAKALNSLLDTAWRSDRAVDLWKIVPRDELLAITYGQSPVTLTIVRRISYRLGVDPTDLLDGCIQNTVPALDPSWTKTLPTAIQPKRRIDRHNLPWLRERLNEELQSSVRSAPPALVVVARKLGVSTGCIRHHFPVHAFEILARHKRWRQLEVRRKHAAAKGAVQRALRDPLVRSQATRKGVLRELRGQTGLPKNVLRREVSRALDVGRVMGRSGVMRPQSPKARV